MAKNKINEASVYTSGNKPKSKVFKSIFTKRLSSIFGFQTVDRDKATNDFERSSGLKFVKVDVGSQAYRIKQASLGSIFKETPLNTTLSKYLDAYLSETTLSYSDISERQIRLGELDFAIRNDPYLSRVCKLVADEATQLDTQNRLVSVESTSPAFVNKCYELFAQWGLTQTRIHSVCYDLERYGEAVWAHRVTERGVERIQPVRVPSMQERLEFSPARMAEYVAQIQGPHATMKNRGSKLQTLIDMLNNESDTRHSVDDLSENFADIFDTKLLGFEFQDGIVVPPWLITHFRYDADTTEFFPYGTPPLLMALAPFQQAHSTMALQGLARQMSFPVQVYKVKQTEGVGPATAFDLTNTVREEYDNIGVTPQSNSLEVYAINTKIWIPEGLVSFETVDSRVDFDFVQDLELYYDRVAIASGVPKAYLDQEFGGFGNSGIALMEQYKPFARHVYTIQSAFLEGLGQLIRLHFAITNEFDYNTPFVLSMRFPAEEMGDEKRNARNASIDLATNVIDFLTSVLGIDDSETLPEDVLNDILAKYTFLDPTDLKRWIRLSSIQKAASSNASGEDDDLGDDDGFDFGGGGSSSDFSVSDDTDFGSDDTEVDFEAGPDAVELPESMNSDEYYELTKRRLNNKKKKENSYYSEVKSKVNERKENKKLLREAEVRRRYTSSKDVALMHFLESNNFNEWSDTTRGHALMVPKITENNPLFHAMNVLRPSAEVNHKGMYKLREDSPTMTLTDILNNYKHLNEGEDDNAMEGVQGIISLIEQTEIDKVDFEMEEALQRAKKSN